MIGDDGCAKKYLTDLVFSLLGPRQIIRKFVTHMQNLRVCEYSIEDTGPLYARGKQMAG
jgi:hypothetical protein